MLSLRGDVRTRRHDYKPWTIGDLRPPEGFVLVDHLLVVVFSEVSVPFGFRVDVFQNSNLLCQRMQVLVILGTVPYNGTWLIHCCLLVRVGTLAPSEPTERM